MRSIIISIVILGTAAGAAGQGTAARKIYETERAFEKLVAEQSLRAGFLEYLTSDAVMFFPEAANARETWAKRPESPAALTWNPVLIDVSSNGALGYSIGNSIYRPKGKSDSTGIPGHYISVWMRQPDGNYRAVLDTGINHDTPAGIPTDWRETPGDDANNRGISASDSSTGFYQTIEAGATIQAYKNYLAEDVVLMRDGLQPLLGKKAATEHLKKQKGRLTFAKRKSFVEAADLAYVHGAYSIAEAERGNYVQIWRLRNGKWQIVADVLIPLPMKR